MFSQSVDALQKQVDNDFGAAWGVDAMIYSPLEADRSDGNSPVHIKRHKVGQSRL